VDAQPPPLDLSGLHRELDRLKTLLCRCNHSGECLACRGFEVLREQSQMVAAAASQPVLMQVAQEAAVKDLMSQLGGIQEKLVDDPRLHELLGQLVERVQEDLGGPEHLQRLFGNMGGFPGFGGQTPPDDASGPTPPDDRPPTPPRPRSED
jgi:hypothetical protein